MRWPFAVKAKVAATQVNVGKGQEENNSLSPCYRGRAAVKAAYLLVRLYINPKFISPTTTSGCHPG